MRASLEIPESRGDPGGRCRLAVASTSSRQAVPRTLLWQLVRSPTLPQVCHDDVPVHVIHVCTVRPLAT